MGICDEIVSFLMDSVRWKTRDDDGNFQLILDMFLYHNINFLKILSGYYAGRRMRDENQKNIWAALYLDRVF